MQASTEPVSLLLKDKQAEKATHVLAWPSIPRQLHTPSCIVLQGELVTPIPHSNRVPRNDGQKTHNFRTVSRDSPATFYEADDGTDVAPLSANEYGVLAGVKSPGARYQIFLKKSKLDWGTKLKIGDQVSVELPPDRASAVVRYVGEVKTLPGITFGVEITDKNYLGWGTSDGLFQEHQYFRCRADCAMFVSLEKLSRHPPVDSLTQPPPSGQHYTPQPKDRRTSSSTESSAKFIYKIGDRVVVFTKKEVPVHGVVIWVGMHTFMAEKKQKSFKCVGIETDVKVKSNEIDSLPSKSHWFTPGKGKSAVFLLEDQVLLEAHFTGEPPEKPPVPDRPQPLAGEGGSEEESAALARAIGIEQSDLLQQHKKAMQEIMQRRRQKELEEIKHAVPDETLNVSNQETLLRQISEGRNREVERGRRQGRGGGDQHHEHKKNIYDTVGPGSFYRDVWRPDQHQQGQQPPSQHQIDHQQQNNLQQNGQPSWQAPDHPLQPDAEQQQPGYCQYDHHTSQNVPHTRAPHGPPSAGPHGPPSAVPSHRTVPPHLQPGHQHMAYGGQQRSSHHAGLEVGSAVRIANNDSRTGVVRWIGPLPGVQGEVAGVELDEPMGGCGDGEWNGHRYFTCPYGRGLFCTLVNLRPDTRIMSQYAGGHGAAAAGHGNPLQVSDWEEQDQTVPGDQFHKYIGDQRGIQGHQNSCYLDATIFGLFALSDMFDSLFLNSEVYTSIMQGGSGTPAQQVQRDIGEKLWKGIVNPLRRNGAVRFESVMRLRNKLDELGKMEGVSTAEKDPEEFLNMLFKHTLHVEPFIQIKRPFGTEPEFFVQLFVEFDESLKIPTIDTLLQRMFKEQQISFAEVPSKLLIHVPRYGKQFQTYKRIIPGIKLDPTPLLDFPYTCYICGEPAWNTCGECGKGDLLRLCRSCDGVVHKHKSRSNHKREQCRGGEDVGRELELLSVLCIETSHYVCFTRDVEGRWLFFDSMANRVYDQYNIPRGVDCTAELTEWVYEGSPERLMAAGPRDLPELVRRFTQDVYMCVYIQPDYGMYGDTGYKNSSIAGTYTPYVSDYSLLNIECSGEKELKKEVEQLQKQLSDAQDSNHQLQIQCQQKTDQLQLEQLNSQQLQQQLEQEQDSKAQLQQQLEQEQHRRDQVEQQLQQLQQHNHQLQQQLQQEQQRARNLQERLDRSAGEMLNMRPATAVLMNVAFCTAKRSEVKTGAIIGEGAWGKVERGVFKGSPVAVKSIHAAILKQNTVERLRREINIMAQVRHPNLVRFIAAVLDGPAERLQAPPMIITELMDINLRQAYEEKRVVPAHYLTILRDVAYGLHHLHSLQQPIIHRDVSAPNVLLQQQPNGGWLAKVSDFGSANFAKQARTAGEGAIIYSAPETFPSTVSDPDSEPPLLTTKVDVFSYGVMACELVMGEMPASDKYRAMLQKVEKKWAFMHGLIVRCTKRNALERPSMADILDELPQPIPRPLK